MPTSRTASALPGRRLLAAVTAATILTGLFTVTDARGSAPAHGGTTTTTASGSAPPGDPAPTPSTTPTPPSPPTGLTASVTATSVTLAWTASRPGCCAVAGYEITWNEAFDDIFRLTPAGDVTTFTITQNIRPATQYTFRVMAYDSAGNRSTSPSVTVVTPLSDTAADTTPPRAPSGLTVTGEAVLSWSGSTDDVAVTGYNVYWYDGWFTSRLVATVSGTSYAAALPSPRNVFYVRAREAAGNVSIASNTVIVTPSTAPPVCRVKYGYTAQWDGGFVASVTITNIGTDPLNGWTLSFAAGSGQRVTSAWNATYDQAGSAVTLRNVEWNGSLAVGASRSIGFEGSSTSTPSVPDAFTVNGLPCTTG